MKFLKSIFNNSDDKKFKKLAEKELQENLDVIESLRKYDNGEKNISTRNVEKRLRDIPNLTR